MIFITIPVALPVAEKINYKCLIYNRADKHSLFNEANTKVVESLEQKLLRRADITIYASRVLMKEELVLTNDRALHLDHGVDSEHFEILSRTR